MLAMTAPLILSFWMRSAFSFVDTAYAAILGDAALAAIGLAIPLEFAMIACWVGLSNGLTSRLSQAMGAGEGARVEQLLSTAWKMITRALLPFFLAGAAGIWLGAPYMGLDPEVARMFAIYGTVTLAGSALTSFWSILPDSLVKAHQDTRSTMWAGIWSNVINVTLNTLFLFVFHWGIFGIAFSTVLGRFGGLIYAQRKARAHEEARKAAETTPSTRLDERPYRAILSLALPSAAAYGLMALEASVVNIVLATTGNPTASIAAYSIYYRVMMFAVMPLIAASVAALPYTARHFGAGDLGAVRRGFREVSLGGLAYSVLLVAPAAWFGGPPLAALLAEEPITALFGGFALRLVPLACIAAIPFFICRPIFEGMGQGHPGLWMSVLRYLILTVPLAYGGVAVAGTLGQPGFYGLMAGLLVATALSSGATHVWLVAALRRAEGVLAAESGCQAGSEVGVS
jgi:Na+-driven multidrug efflux pump